MLVKGIIDEDFVNYKKPNMFVMCHSCAFKCDKECEKQVCQNGTLANSPNVKITTESLVNRYINNNITMAVVFGGLEPFDDIDNVMLFINLLRNKYHNKDDVVIYTGYTKEEIINNYYDYYVLLKEYSNIVIKYGRFVPNQQKHFDSTLGVFLASDNQYAEVIK